MRFRRKSGEYPNLLDRDVLTGGVICRWRNPADKGGKKLVLVLLAISKDLYGR